MHVQLDCNSSFTKRRGEKTVLRAVARPSTVMSLTFRNRKNSSRLNRKASMKGETSAASQPTQLHRISIKIPQIYRAPWFPCSVLLLCRLPVQMSWVSRMCLERSQTYLLWEKSGFRFFLFIPTLLHDLIINDVSSFCFTRGIFFRFLCWGTSSLLDSSFISINFESVRKVTQASPNGSSSGSYRSQSWEKWTVFA